MADKRTPEQRKAEIKTTCETLQAAVHRFIYAANNDDFTSTKKMLEIATHEIEPAMQAVVKAKTGVQF